MSSIFELYDMSIRRKKRSRRISSTDDEDDRRRRRRRKRNRFDSFVCVPFHHEVDSFPSLVLLVLLLPFWFIFSVDFNETFLGFIQQTQMSNRIVQSQRFVVHRSSNLRSSSTISSVIKNDIGLRSRLSSQSSRHTVVYQRNTGNE